MALLAAGRQLLAAFCFSLFSPVRRHQKTRKARMGDPSTDLFCLRCRFIIRIAGPFRSDGRVYSRSVDETAQPETKSWKSNDFKRERDSLSWRSRKKKKPPRVTNSRQRSWIEGLGCWLGEKNISLERTSTSLACNCASFGLPHIEHLYHDGACY